MPTGITAKRAGVAEIDADDELAELLRGCVQGRQAALKSLYDALSPQLFALVTRILKRRDLAEEVLQDTFISVWRHASDYSAAKGSVRTWVLSIGRYRALDVLRREGREVHWTPETVSAALAGEGESGDGDEVVSHAERRALNDCLMTLSESQLHSLRLAYFHGQTHEEIAVELRTPIGTVKSWIRRGLASLKRCLEP